MCPTDEWMLQVNKWSEVRRELRANQRDLARAGLNHPANPHNYLFNLLIAIDQLGNAFAGGDPDETISSRIGKQKLRDELNLVTTVIDAVLEMLDDNHSIDAIEPDEGLPDPRTLEMQQVDYDPLPEDDDADDQ